MNVRNFLSCLIFPTATCLLILPQVSNALNFNKASISSSTIMESRLLIAELDCVANNNLTETAQTYIGRCRRGGINKEFPGELLNETLKNIKAGSAANYTKAWKLLNDNRFVK
jgi:hypothetical protein